MNIAQRNQKFMTALSKLRPQAVIFDTPQDFIEGVFGKPQHDDHCLKRRRYLWLERELENGRRALNGNYGWGK